MAYYLIKYFGQSGSVESVAIEAESKEQAIAASGVPNGIIKTVAVDALGGIKAALRNKKFPLIEQALMLSAISSKLVSGKTFSKAVTESVPYKKLGITPQQVEVCQTAREYLLLFRFDETAVLLAEAGERSGKMPEALLRAANTIKERVKAKKEFGKAMTQGIMYSVLGLKFLIGIPLWAGSTLIDFIEVQKLEMKLNTFSHLILFLHTVYTHYAIPVLGVIAAGFYFRKQVWNTAKNWPFIRVLNERNKIQRGLEFVQTYQLLLSSGYTNPQAFKFMHLRSKGQTYDLYGEAVERLAEGRELSEIFLSDEWPPIINQNLQGFESQAPDGRDGILGNLANALKEYYLQYSEKISKFCSTIGFMAMVITILMFAIGFYLPLVSLSSGMR